LRILFDVFPLEWLGFACAQIFTLWKLIIACRVNIVTSVTISYRRNWECRTIFSKTIGKIVHVDAYPPA
jgi:hypothetical protein